MSTAIALIPDAATALPTLPGPADLLEAFLAGRKPTTLRAYDRDLSDFARFLGLRTSREAVGVLLAGSHGRANEIALAYRTHLAARGLKSATIARRLSTLRSFVGLARLLGHVHWTLDVTSPRVTLWRDTTGPGDAGWRQVLDLVKAEAAAGSAIGRRNLAIVRLLHDMGLRRAECIAIDLADLDLGASRIAVLGKGRTDREWLTMPPLVVAAVKGWLEARGEAAGPLFHRVDRPGPRRLSANGLYDLILAIGRRAGLSKALRPHGLRHQAITQVLDRNHGDLRAAARFSRHRDISTLAKYDDNRADLGGSMALLISEE